MKIDEIKTIVKLMAENNLTEFKIESDEMKLCLRRSEGSQNIQPAMTPVAFMPTPAPAPVSAMPVSVPEVVTSEENPIAAKQTVNKDKIIESPTVGTFYRTSSPGAEPFVKVGSHVDPETTVAIVEAMKVMNEIKAERSGVIKEILLENGQPVEFGQALFVLE